MYIVPQDRRACVLRVRASSQHVNLNVQFSSIQNSVLL